MRRMTLEFMILTGAAITACAQDSFGPGGASFCDWAAPHPGLYAVPSNFDLTNGLSSENGAGEAATPPDDDSARAAAGGRSAAVPADAPTGEQSAATPAAETPVA